MYVVLHHFLPKSPFRETGKGRTQGPEFKGPDTHAGIALASGLREVVND